MAAAEVVGMAHAHRSFGNSTMTDNILHVVPVDDLREHDSNKECWCKPQLDPTDTGGLWVHNAMDGREQFETGERMPS